MMAKHFFLLFYFIATPISLIQAKSMSCLSNYIQKYSEKEAIGLQIFDHQLQALQKNLGSMSNHRRGRRSRSALRSPCSHWESSRSRFLRAPRLGSWPCSVGPRWHRTARPGLPPCRP